MFFCVNLDLPIKQGQTRYHYLVFSFMQEDETELELPFTEEELAEKYQGKLEKDMKGPTFEVVSKLMKAIVNKKITVPGNFIGHSGTPAISCSYKAASGFIYPLERGFIFVYKPPIFVKFDDVQAVNFARSGGSNRSFDIEIKTRGDSVYTFSSIGEQSSRSVLSSLQIPRCIFIYLGPLVSMMSFCTTEATISPPAGQKIRTFVRVLFKSSFFLKLELNSSLSGTG